MNLRWKQHKNTASRLIGWRRKNYYFSLFSWRVAHQVAHHSGWLNVEWNSIFRNSEKLHLTQQAKAHNLGQLQNHYAVALFYLLCRFLKLFFHKIHPGNPVSIFISWIRKSSIFIIYTFHIIENSFCTYVPTLNPSTKPWLNAGSSKSPSGKTTSQWSSSPDLKLTWKVNA